MNFQPDKALKHRVVLLAGDEDAWRQQALRDLLAAAGIQKDDFDLQTYSADESTPMDWFAASGTSPFFAERRTVIVRHLLRCELDKLKGTKFANLPDFALIILVADDEAGDENKMARLKTLRKNWEKAIAEASGFVYSVASDPKKVKEAVKAEAALMGKTISEPAADALVEMTGESLSRALDELRKIELFIGSQTNIRESDVREVVMPSREWNVFRMVDSVFQGRVGEALTQLRVLMGSSTKAEDAAFSRILPQVSRHLRLVWQARSCVEAKCGPSNAPDVVLRTFPEKNNLAREAPYRQNQLMRSANGLTFPQLEHCFAIVADTDARLKGGLSSFSSLDTLERMLLEMAAVVTPSRA